MQSLIKLFYRRQVIMNIVIILIVCCAVYSGFSLKRLGFPRVDLARLYIDIVYPGASAEDVELDIATKIEDAIRDVDGVKDFSSESLENACRITVTIDDADEDLESVKADIKRAVDSVKLPAVVTLNPVYTEENVDSLPIYEVAVFKQAPGDLSNHDKELLRQHVKELQRRLQKVENVSRVISQGNFEPEIQVKLNLGVMKSLQVGINEVMVLLSENKFRIPSGDMTEGGEQLKVVATSDFVTPESIGKMVVRDNVMNRPIYLEDLAEIKLDYEKQKIKIRANGYEGVILYINKAGSADIIDTVQDLESVLDDYRKILDKSGFTAQTMVDLGVNTRTRLDAVFQNAAVGFVLVLIVLMFFLNSKIAFWTAFGIPLAAAIAVILMPLVQITINSISLVGIVVVLGMLVDDAIIIAESIYNAKEQGKNGIDGALYGLNQVFAPVVVSVITTIAAFIPMFFLPGDAGKFAIEVPTIVIIMLTASLCEATIILPVHLAHSKEVPNKKALGERVLIRASSVYKVLLTTALRWRWFALLGMVAFLSLGALVMLKHTKFKMFPLDEAFQINLYGELPPSLGLDDTLIATRHLEQIIASHPQAKDILVSYKTQAGVRSMYANNSGVPMPGGFTMRIVMVQRAERTISATEFKDYIWSHYEDPKRGLRRLIHLDFYIDGGGPFQGKPVEINLSSNDDIQRQRAMDFLQEKLAHLPLTEIDQNNSDGRRELTIIPDLQALARSSLSGQQVGQIIRTAYEGTVVNSFRRNDDRIGIRVKVSDSSKLDAKDPVGSLMILNPQGNLIDLAKVVKVEMRDAPLKISRKNGYRSSKVTANIKVENVGSKVKTLTPVEVGVMLEPIIAELKQKFSVVDVEFGGEVEKDAATLNSLLGAIGIAVIVIYCLLIIQFNSFFQPIMVLLAIPFGLVGIIVAFAMHDYNLSMLSLVGVLGFAGVIVNNSLLIVEFINREGRSQDVGNWRNAIIDGAAMRLRPILLTTLTTVAGLLPTAYGWIGGFDSFISPMVFAMTWGLMVGTIATLFVIPLLYDVFSFKKPKRMN